MATRVVAWVDSFNDDYPTSSFNEEKHRALAECIKKRKYNFSYQMLSFNPYSTPVYKDGTKCLLTKQQWDDVLSDAYKDDDLGTRLTPMDVLNFKANDALWEKESYYHDMAGE